MTSARVCAVLAAVVLGVMSNAAAQERDTSALTPIVVTATRAAAPSNTLPNAVTVLDGDDLARAGIVTVSDAVRALAGVSVARNGSFGGVTSLFLRGGQSNYVRVLVDGVPVNATGGYLDLANLSTTNVERIELVRGPASVLYGSDAVSGVMQIFTRHGAGRRVTVTAGGGSHGSADVAAELAAGGPRLGATLAASETRADGLYAFNNRYRNTTLSGSAHLAPDFATDVTLAARYGEALFHYPTDGTGAPVDSNQFQAARTLTASLDAGHFFTSRLELRVLLGYGETRARTEDAQDNPADTSGLYEYHSRGTTTRRSADARLNLRGGSSVFTLGGAIESESERDTNSYRSSFGPGGGSLDTSRSNRALYAQAVSGWWDRMWVQAGVRLDDNDKFGSFGTWRLGVSALISAGTRVRANVGTAFKEPTFDQNYSSGFTIGNPDLRPEHSRSWELGIERAIVAGKGSIAVAYFDQRFRDMIQYAYLSPGAPNYYNVAGANATGVEVEARLVPSAAMRVRAQYSFVHTSVADSGYDGATFAPGRPLVRRPEHSASFTADATPVAGLWGGVQVAWVGRREDLDFARFPAARVTLDAYTRVDLWTDIALTRPAPGRSALALTARLDNVFGAVYTEVFGFRTPGRVLKVGGRIETGR